MTGRVLRMLGLVVLALGATGCAAMGPALVREQSAGDAQVAGCGPAAEPTLDASFIRFADGFRRDPAPLRSLAEASQAAVDRWGFAETTPDLGDDHDARFRVLDGAALVTYLLKQPLAETDSSVDAFVDGAVRVTETVRTGLTLERHLETFTEYGRERVEQVRIGPYEGMVSRGDEIAPGVRVWGVTWYEGDTRWKVSAVRDRGAEVIDLARSMVCGAG